MNSSILPRGAVRNKPIPPIHNLLRKKREIAASLSPSPASSVSSSPAASITPPLSRSNRVAILRNQFKPIVPTRQEEEWGNEELVGGRRRRHRTRKHKSRRNRSHRSHRNRHR